jgi:hypothetical protein
MSRPDGTPDDEREPVEATATPDGTPDDGGDDDKGKLIASLQEKAARVNAAEREAAELKERIARLEADTPPAREEDGGDTDRATRFAKALQSAALDPSHPQHDYAVFEMEKWRRQRAEIEEVKRDLKFDAMPDDERDGARKFLESGDYRTPEAARKAWVGSLDDDARKKLKRFSGNSPKPKDAPAREREEIVDTATRPLSPAGVSQRTLKMGEWGREWDKAEGAGDTKRMDELRKAYPR